MVNQKEVCVLKFSKILDKVYANNQFSSKEADDAKLQCDEFLDRTAKRNQEKFLSFGMKFQCLDKSFRKMVTSK